MKQEETRFPGLRSSFRLHPSSFPTLRGRDGEWCTAPRGGSRLGQNLGVAHGRVAPLEHRGRGRDVTLDWSVGKAPAYGQKRAGTGRVSSQNTEMSAWFKSGVFRVTIRTMNVP
jgi:hypothetical protein